MFLLTFIGSLWAADIDFINIKEGDPAPFSGKLFTEEAVSKILANHEAEILQADLDREYELEKQSDKFNLNYELYETKCEANIEMYKGMIIMRDDELNAQARKDWLQRLAFYGGFAIGTATTIGIVYSVNQN